MGETTIEGAVRGWRRNGLMQRLAALDEEARRLAASGVVFSRGVERRTFFALGLLASIVLGGAVHFALPRPGQAAGAVFGAPANAVGAIWDRRHQLVLDMPILREDAPVPFPLQVTGLDAVRDARVILQHLPEAVWFSRGERRDEHTWDLARADLDDLQLTLRAGSPEAFEVEIEVVGPDATRLAQSSAYVRLVDRAAPGEASASLATAPAAVARPPAPASKAEATAQDWATQTSTKRFVPREALLARVPVGAEPSPAAPETVARAPLPRPPGMSALGAVSHEPTLEGRWLWWKMPLPALAFFNKEDGARR